METLVSLAALRQAERGLPTRFQLVLDEHATQRRSVQAVLRHLPGQRLVLQVAQPDGSTAIAKVFFRDGVREAAVERRGLLAYAAAGLAVPKVLSDVEIGTTVVLFIEAIAPAATLAQRWPRLPASERSARLGQLVSALAILHDSGVRLWDPHFGNFLLRDGVAGAALVAVDGGALRVSDGAVSLRARVDDLALLLAQLPLVDDVHLDGVLDAYGAAIPKDVLIFRRAEARAKRIRTMERKSQRECSEYHVRRSWRRTTVVRREHAAAVLPILDELDRAMAAGSSLKAGRTATVVALRDAGGAEWICKRYNIKSFRHWLARAFRPSRAERAWLAAVRLEALGIPTPQAGALVVERFGPLRGRAFLLCARAPGEPLSVILAGTIASQSVDLPLRIAAALALLHSGGVVHGDLKASNLFVDDRGVNFIDLDSLTTPCCDAWRQRGQQRDRARLLANIADSEQRAAWQDALAAAAPDSRMSIRPEVLR